MTQYAHGDPGVHVERGQESGTGMPHVVHGNAADACLGAACLETPVQVPRLEWRTGPGREYQPALSQGGACGAAGPASAPGSASEGPPSARRATHSHGTQIVTV
jgi:hypothetical protein